MRIVIADDYATFRRVISDILRSAGHDVSEVGDGPALLARIVADTPDLVISDLRLPTASAITVLEGVRERAIAVRVVVMTGVSPDLELRSELARLGVSNVLHKPFTMRELEEIIASIEAP